MSVLMSSSEILQIVPQKSDDILIEEFDNGDYLLTHTVHQFRMKINEVTKILLELVDGKKNIQQLSYEISEIGKKEIKAGEIYEVLYNHLGKFQVIENTIHKVKPLSKPDYLKLSFQLISKEKLNGIIKPMTFMFNKQFFYTTFTIMLLAVLFIGYNNGWTKVYNLFSSNEFFFLLVISFSTVFFHELGHASACMKHGGNHGEIGFGFYLLSPVLYADVSDIWKLAVDKRIIVNLAGIYMQVLIGFIFGCLYLYNGNYFYLGLMTSVTGISLLYNLNPFLRSDGYWILSDLLRINNLRKKSNDVSVQFLKNLPLKVFKNNFNKNEIYFLLYGLISNLFIFAFIGIAFYYNSFSLFNFPVEAYKAIFEYIKYDKIIDRESVKTILLSFIFYFTLYRFLKAYFLKNYESKKVLFNDLLIIVLAAVYFLSAIGKILSYDNFLLKAKQYPFYFEGVTYLIIGVELFLALGFISFRYIKIVSKISVIFLGIITSIYVYSYYSLNIKDCDCFGYFSFLNSNNLLTTVIKNLFLALLPIYYMYKTKTLHFKINKSLFALGIICIITFLSFQLEDFTSKQLALSFKGKNVESISFSPEISKADYIFIFSPKCPHCFKLIPQVNELQGKVNLIGITGKKYEKDPAIKGVKFKTLFLEKNDLNKITSIVPVLFTIKDNIIIDVSYPNDKIIENIGVSRKSSKE